MRKGSFLLTGARRWQKGGGRVDGGGEEKEEEEEEGGDASSLLVERQENTITFFADVSLRSVSRLLALVHEARRDGFAELHLHIHSYGGDAFAGLVAYHRLREARVKLVTYVDGMAASAATFLLLAGETRRAFPHSFVLIHQLSGGMFGKYRDLIDEMNNTHDLMKVFVRLYKERTTMKVSQIKALLTTERCIPALRCVAKGIVHEVVGKTGVSA